MWSRRRTSGQSGHANGSFSILTESAMRGELFMATQHADDRGQKRDRVLVLTVRVGCRVAPYHPPLLPTTRKVTVSAFLVVVTHSQWDELT